MEDNILSLGEIAKEQKRNSKKAKKEAVAAKKADRIKKIKRTIWFIILFLIAFAIAIYWFAKNYYIQSPVTFETRPAVVKLDTNTLIVLSPLAEAKEEKILTDIEIIEQYRFAPILKGVYMLESTWGQNDFCKEKGQFNGFGYRQNERENKCYESFAKVVEIVNDWYEQRLSENGNNLVEALCFYNKGVANMNSCEYSQKFMSILVDNL